MKLTKTFGMCIIFFIILISASFSAFGDCDDLGITADTEDGAMRLRSLARAIAMDFLINNFRTGTMDNRLAVVHAATAVTDLVDNIPTDAHCANIEQDEFNDIINDMRTSDFIIHHIGPAAGGTSAGATTTTTTTTTTTSSTTTTTTTTTTSSTTTTTTTTTTTLIDLADLVGLWHLDENADDSSGNNNHGTINGAVCGVAGQFGNACSFDGNNDYISIPDDMVDLTADFSVAIWINPDDNSQNPRWFSILNNPVNLAVGHMGSDEVYFRLSGTVIKTSYTLTYGPWYHIVWIFENSNRHIYINREEKATVSGGISADSTFSAIGAGYSTTSYTTGGIIDEVSIWSRVLTPDEINILYNNPVPNP